MSSKSPLSFHTLILCLFVLLVDRSHTMPAPAPNALANDAANLQHMHLPISRRQGISAIPPGELNEIFSGGGTKEPKDPFACKLSDKKDATIVNDISPCWDQYQYANGSAGLRCGGKGWYRGHGKNYQDQMCQDLCADCISDGVRQGYERVDCSFGVTNVAKCWLGYH